MSIFHRHKHAIVDVQHVGIIVMPGTHTIVLSRCDCGNLKTETVNGRWTVEQLRGASSSPGTSPTRGGIDAINDPNGRGGHMPGREAVGIPKPPPGIGAGSQGAPDA